MKRTAGAILAVVLLAGMAACATRQPVQTFQVPPRIDLKQHEMIGVLEFTSTNKGKLGPMVTRKFTESARRDQGMVRMVEIPKRTEVPSASGNSRMDAEAYRALGKKHGVRTILAGTLTVSDVRPNFKVAPSLLTGEVTAQVQAALEVQMIEAETGASLWSRSSSAVRNVGHISVFGGKNFVFDADDPEKAYGDLVNVLVNQVTGDFHATWEQR